MDDVTSSRDTKKVVEDEKKDIKGNRKRQKGDKEDIRDKQESERPSSPLVKRRRTLSHDNSIPATTSKTQGDEQKSASEDRPPKQQPDVVSPARLDKTRNENGLRFSSERSFEENRLDATRVYELEISIAEKERMLSQQQRTVELRDLQLQQERDVVRGLRASLREEEQAKRELQARYEAINSEMLVRNAREAIADSRMSELERELSELNLTLSSSRNENERLGQEIREVRQSNVS